MIHRYDPSVGQYYRKQTDAQKRAYFDSFASLRALLVDADKPTLQHKSAELTKVQFRTHKLLATVISKCPVQTSKDWV